MPILLDTNALVWMDSGDLRLGALARRTIDDELKANSAFVCPISYWEVQLAINRKRIALSVPIEQWRQHHTATGYVERPITGNDTILMAKLPDLHGDPADRLVMAVAINAVHTADGRRKNLGLAGDHETHGHADLTSKLDC